MTREPQREPQGNLNSFSLTLRPTPGPLFSELTVAHLSPLRGVCLLQSSAAAAARLPGPVVSVCGAPGGAPGGPRSASQPYQGRGPEDTRVETHGPPPPP